MILFSSFSFPQLDIRNDNDVLWGGVLGKAHQAQEAVPQSDVLTDLFLVSNQLRTERETMLLQSLLKNERPAEMHLTAANYNDSVEESRQVLRTFTAYFHCVLSLSM